MGTACMQNKVGGDRQRLFLRKCTFPATEFCAKSLRVSEAGRQAQAQGYEGAAAVCDTEAGVRVPVGVW